MPDAQGITALHLSCLYGKKKILQLLLNAGANLRCRDKAKSTPIHYSCAEGNIEVIGSKTRDLASLLLYSMLV